jgi:hypothetical protein
VVGCPESVRWSDHYYSVPRSAVEDRCAHFRASSGVGNRGCVRVVESRSAELAGGSLSRAADLPLPLSGTAFRALFWRPPRLVAPRQICFPSPAPCDHYSFLRLRFCRLRLMGQHDSNSQIRSGLFQKPISPRKIDLSLRCVVIMLSQLQPIGCVFF